MKLAVRGCVRELSNCCLNLMSSLLFFALSTSRPTSYAFSRLAKISKKYIPLRRYPNYQRRYTSRTQSMQRRNFSDHILNYHKRQNEISEAAVHCGFVLKLVAKWFPLSTPLVLRDTFFDNLWANKKCKLLENILQVGNIPRGNSKRQLTLQECFHCKHFSRARFFSKNLWPLHGEHFKSPPQEGTLKFN